MKSKFEELFNSLFSGLKNIIQHSLVKNSFFITASRIINSAIIGFLFWKIASQFYSLSDVGIGIALLSSVDIIIFLSLLGFDISLIRYMQIFDKNKVFNSALFMTVTASVILSILYLVILPYISPAIIFLRDQFLWFVVFSIFGLLYLIMGRTYLAFKEGRLFFLHNLLLAVRLPLLCVFVFLGGIGIFFSMGFAYLITIVVSSVFLSGLVKFKLDFNFSIVRKMIQFSFLNYFSNILFLIPILVMPIVILTLLGPEQTAIYYIAFSIGNLVIVIPEAIGLSFLMEGCHKDVISRKTMRFTFILIYTILIPIISIFYFFGKNILMWFGSSYVQGFDLTFLIVLSSLVISVYHIFIQVQNINFRPKRNLLINCIYAVSFILLSWIFLPQYGIVGVGYAWISTFCIIAVIGGSILLCEKQISGTMHHDSETIDNS